MTKEITYTTEKGNQIQMSLYGPDYVNKRPLILYLHGFKGFKDWAFVPYIGSYLIEKELTMLAFNFSHNGIGSELDQFTELDKFQANTFSLEVKETIEIVKAITQTNILGDIVDREIGILGHSRGGGIGLLAARKLREVSAICTWGAVSTFDRYEKKSETEMERKRIS